MLSRSPSWKRTGNSFSPISRASPSVAATLPAVSEASDVVSSDSRSPMAAICCPFLSTRKTTFALASAFRRPMTSLIWWNSSSKRTKSRHDGCRAVYPITSPGGPSRDRESVTSSANSRAAPTGRPNARRVTRDPERLEPAGQVEGRRLPLDVRVRREDDLLDGRTGAADSTATEVGDVELVGPDAPQRRERAPEDVVPPAELARPLEDVDVERLLDDREEPPVARRVGADRAGVLLRQRVADRARARPRAGLRDGGRERRARRTPGAARRQWAMRRALFGPMPGSLSSAATRRSSAGREATQRPLGRADPSSRFTSAISPPKRSEHLLDALVRGGPVPQVLLLERLRVGVRGGRREVAAGRAPRSRRRRARRARRPRPPPPRGPSPRPARRAASPRARSAGRGRSGRPCRPA